MSNLADIFKYLFATFFLTTVFFQTVRADTDAVYLNKETERLEKKIASSDVDEKDRARLAEIYFLTSRCGQIEKLYKKNETEGARYLCACGRRCPESSKEQKLLSLRRLVEKGETYDNPEIKNLGKDLSGEPESYYWLSKALYRSRKPFDKTIRELRLETDRILESYEVR